LLSTQCLLSTETRGWRLLHILNRPLQAVVYILLVSFLLLAFDVNCLKTKLAMKILCVLDRASFWYLNKGRPTWWHSLYYVNLLLNMFRMLIHPSSGACDYLARYSVDCIVLTWGVLVLCSGIGCWWCGTNFTQMAMKSYSFSLGLPLQTRYSYVRKKLLLGQGPNHTTWDTRNHVNMLRGAC